MNRQQFLFFLTTLGYGLVFQNIPNIKLRIESYGQSQTLQTNNIIADTKMGRADRIITVGSHLDSVPAGPGINDNGSGSASNLAIALLMKNISFQPVSKVRFCWWGAEELGLLGSRHYVDDMVENDPKEYNKIVLNLNFDMIGSPNYEIGVYNASSGTQQDIIEGSVIIQNLFEDYFKSNKINYVLVPFTGRSDYGPFIENSVPAGGLAAGAEVLKDENARALFGGLRGIPYDSCYHTYCDTIENINVEGLDILSNAAAHVIEKLALNATLVEQIYNTVQRNFSLPYYE